MEKFDVDRRLAGLEVMVKMFHCVLLLSVKLFNYVRNLLSKQFKRDFRFTWEVTQLMLASNLLDIFLLIVMTFSSTM